MGKDQSMSENLDHIATSLRPLAVPIAQVQIDPANARVHLERNLQIIKGSLTGFGQQKPIVIDAKGICLAGNGTLLAARELGWTHIAVTHSGLSGIEARAYSIADNRASDTSQWDDQILSQHLASLQNDETVEHALTGFNDAEIEQFIDQAMGLEKQEQLADVAITDTYQLLVACNDEADQRQLYERLTQDGYSCRVLTL
jgi:ParB-like chromosome segregation protein Spo0J